MRATLATVFMLAATIASAEAQEAGFGDWRVGCGDAPGSPCAAEAGPEAGPRLSLEDVGPDAEAPFLAIDLPEHGLNTDRPLTLRFPDGASVPLAPGRDVRPFRAAQRWYVTEEAALAGLAGRLKAADHVIVEYFDVTGELHSVPVSLAGYADAARFIAEKRGDAARADRLSPATNLPAAEVTLDSAVEEAGLPEAVVAQHVGSGACEDPGSTLLSEHSVISEPLTPAAILYAVPCSATGENVAYRLYIRERGEIGGVHTLYFPTWSEAFGWGGTDLLHNVAVDGPRLTSVFRGRRRDGCGIAAAFTFVDYAFRLDSLRADRACRGGAPESWPDVASTK